MMDVYLIKDQQIEGGSLEYLTFSEKELNDAKAILDANPDYRPDGVGSAHSKDGKFIQLLGNKRVQVAEELIADPVVDQLIKVMGIKHFEDATGKHPISELSKHKPSD